MRPSFFLWAMPCLLAGCVVGFSNREKHIPEDYKKIYAPAAKDTSVYAGNSSKLSLAVRARLAKRSDISLTNLQNARWALQIKILDRKQSIIAVDSCANPGTPNVASGAYSCAAIHPEMAGGSSNAPTSLSQPSVSPQSEQIALVVMVKAIDLNTGKIFWSKFYKDSIPAAVFNEIGDNGDGRTMVYLQDTPDLHALRYQEAVDNAVESFANAIADDIETQIFTQIPH